MGRKVHLYRYEPSFAGFIDMLHVRKLYFLFRFKVEQPRGRYLFFCALRVLVLFKRKEDLRASHDTYFRFWFYFMFLRVFTMEEL